MPTNTQSQWFGGPKADLGDEISQSLRFRNNGGSATFYLSNANLNWTGNQSYTVSYWLKKAFTGAGPLAVMNIDPFSNDTSPGGTPGPSIHHTASGGLSMYSGSGYASGYTGSPVFKDINAWYHFVHSRNASGWDTWVNGVHLGTASISNLNGAGGTHIMNPWGGGQGQAGSYLAEYNVVDGQHLQPTEFGRFNEDGVWVPKTYTGTYGTKGFHLTFDSSQNANPAVGIGIDSSGNGNHFTSTNFDTAALGTSNFDNDIDYKDTPTSNYPTMNALYPHNARQYSGNFEDGNLSAGGYTTAWSSSGSTVYLPKTGKWYAEFEATLTNSYENWYIGIMSYDTDFGNYYTGYAFVMDHAGSVFENSGTAVAQGTTYAQGDVIGVAVDMDTKTVEWFKNGVSNVSATAASSTWDSYLNDEPGGGGLWIGERLYYNSGQRINVNYGQRPFIYTPPAGYKALHVNNLPEPAIKNGKEHFDAVSFTGAAGAKTITGLQFQPDLVWIKSSSHATQGVVFDSLRGAAAGYHSPHDVGNQETNNGSMTSFNSDGFTVGAGVGAEWSNGGGRQYSAWCWKCDESFTPAVTGGLTNVSGKKNAKAGFSMVTYTGSNTAATIEHGLDSKPHFIWFKRVSGSGGAGDHICWHISIGANNEYHLNNSGSASAFGSTGNWNYAAPSSTVVSIGNGNDNNSTGNTYIAYFFAPVAGYSKFGRYRGNADANGPFVYTGFKPRFIMLKASIGANGSWIMYDTVRDSLNPNTNTLTADSAAAQVLSGNDIDILSNGFKVRDNGSICNGSSQSVEISYLAFAEHPFGGENTPPVPAF